MNYKILYKDSTVIISQDYPDYYYSDDKNKCLHVSCPLCNGTGIRKDGLGMCIHNISCPCPKCSPKN